MRIVSKTGTDHVVDLIQPWLGPSHQIDLASEALTLHAFGELVEPSTKDRSEMFA